MLQIGLFHLCKEAERPEIDTDQRNFQMAGIARRLDQRSVTAKHQNTLRILRNLCRIRIESGLFCLLIYLHVTTAAFLFQEILTKYCKTYRP